MSVGNELKGLRKRLGLTQGELADRAHVSIDTVVNAEKDRSVSSATLALIARALDLPEDHFLQSDGNRSDPAIRRLHFYVDLNDGETLTDEELDAVRRKVLGFAHELIDFINSQRKKD